MIKNYYAIALRNILRNKGISFINVMGISIGMASSFLILFFLLFETSYDTFHANGNNIYRVELDTYRNGVLENKSALTPPAVGISLLENYPEVESYARIASNAGKTVILFGNKSFKEAKAYIADPSVFEVFSFELLKGNPENLFSGPYDVVISERLAEKLIGSNWKQTVALNEMVDLRSDGITGIFKLKGVFKNLPNHSHFNPELMVPRTFLNELAGDAASDQSWDFNFFYTYIKLRPGSNIEALRSKFNAFVADTRKESLASVHAVLDFHLQPLTDIHLKSNIQFELESNGNLKMVYALGIIGLIILIVAWINFINLSTARSIKRAKEVGIRKVLGANKKQLVSQFIMEAMVVNAMALVIAWILVELSRPIFAELSGVPVEFIKLKFLWSNTSLVLTILLILLVGIVISGLYPAFVLSSFNPVRALKADAIKPGGINMRKALVVMQSSLSFMMISGTIIIYKQINFMRSTDLGINIAQTLVVEGPENFDFVNEGAAAAFKSEILNRPFVKGFAMSSVVPSQEVTFRSYNLSSDKTKSNINCGIVGMDSDFINNFKLYLIAGESFSETKKNTASVILNEEASKQLGFNTPEESIGATLIHDNGRRREVFVVAGVVKDYHQRSLKSSVEPILFRHGIDLKYYSIKFEPQAWDEMQGNIELLSQEFKKFFPGNPFNYFFLDQQFNSQYKSDQKFGTVFFTFSIIAIIISSLGLFGLSTFMVSLRKSEIGVRKVFGASTGSITLLLLKGYFNLQIVATVIGIPIIYYASTYWLRSYSFKIEVGPIMFIAPILMLVLITAFTVGIQSLRAARKNPIDSIRTE